MQSLPTFLVFAHVVLATTAVMHALLHKRHSRAALGWVLSIVVYPVIGPIAYGIFGINRVRTRSRKLRDDVHGQLPFYGVHRRDTTSKADWEPGWLGEPAIKFLSVGEALTASGVATGNDVRLLQNGDEAYPEMLAAIASAEHRVWLSTYIFETNATGQRFVEALADAHKRGVDVRVIVDGVGAYYAYPTAVRSLRKRGVRVKRFLPPRLFPPQLFINLRTHRKLLCVDSSVAFAGGMNIGGRHMVDAPETRHPTRDVQVRFDGPIAVDLERLFAHDWGFARRRVEPYEPVKDPPTPRVEDGVCRVIPDGPDHNLRKLEALYVGVTSTAEKEVTIVTPYFLPSEALTGALVAASLRGVNVRVILPEKSNLMYVQAATRRVLPSLIRYGVEIRHQPPPFDHTKLFCVDGVYALIGSANVDPRSLRLNFEVGVEVVDSAFSAYLSTYVDTLIARSHVVELESLTKRPLWNRLFDSVCWLGSPYL